MRFDGEATYLERSGLAERLRGFTLFVVAAPLSNGGGFRAFAAMHQDRQPDFTSAYTLDLGPGFTGRFESLNVEGNGFGGAGNLMADASEFGVVRRMAITSAAGAGGTKLWVDGKPGRSRDRKESELIADRLLVGARFYGSPPDVRGFLEGDILQILLYDRVLDQAERREVEGYLASRPGEGSIVRAARPGIGKPLVAAKDPPPVQMRFVPGFSARELHHVDLKNINNVRYRPDGRLVVLGYDTAISICSPTATATAPRATVETFWESKGRLRGPIGMALTPPGYERGEGVFVASKGKVSLIVDADHDGKAEKEIVVASGWKELPHGVDALGVAIDGQGNIYFGLGTTDFTNAYVLDKKGESTYRLEDEHGTIQKVSPDFGRREIVATGVRFPVGLAFNAAGDLFATDQEGATWLPNGNPFDELLHIQPKRHYGFPPRHPKHLPSVVDEPSVFDYAPQHQSTCGLFFNGTVDGGPVFGPDRWRGDALVTGYSRGKLFRTELAKTPAGYVGRNHLIAVLTMLPADACSTSALRGNLVVLAASQRPARMQQRSSGQGQVLGKIEPSDIAPAPQLRCSPGRPIRRSPRRIRSADRPGIKLEESLSATACVDRVRSPVREPRRPLRRPCGLGYEVVGRQMATPRFDLPILSAQVSADRRTLLLATVPHPEAASYALTLPGWGKPRPGSLRQVPEVDLGYDLSGVEAAWTPETGPGGLSAWLPHPDLAVARAFTRGSAEHDRFRRKPWPGRRTPDARTDADRPGIQIGSGSGRAAWLVRRPRGIACRTRR